MYIGNDLQIAHPSYKIIDDISSGFNGSTTSFALQVSGATPVPFPISTQQVMISVNGVVQEPDPNGSAGFKLLGSNIVFSSAPANGHAFFGVINAGADYVTAGSEFPDGSATAPSFTFQDDQDTGWYRNASGDVGYSSNGSAILNFDGNGLTIAAGKGLTVDTSTLKVDAANNRVGIGTTSPSDNLHIAESGATHSFVRFSNSNVSDGWSLGAHATTGRFQITQNGVADRIVIDSSGRLLLGTTTAGFSAGDNLTVADTGHCGISIRSGTSNEGNLFFSDGTSGDDQIRGYVQYNHSNNNLILATNAVTALTIDSSQKATFAGTLQTEGSHNYLQSSSNSMSTLTLRKSANGADSIDYIQCRDSSNALKYKVGGSGNVEGTSFTATGTIAASGDITASGGAGAVTVAAGSDIRFPIGDWSGNSGTTPKIQGHSNNLYICGGSDGIIFREDGTNRWNINGDGYFLPGADSTYDIGSNSTRVRNVYADTLYGDGSNLTNLPAGGNTVDLVADGAIGAGKPVLITSAGKVEPVQAITVSQTPTGKSVTSLPSNITGYGIAGIWHATSDKGLIMYRNNTNTSGVLKYRQFRLDSGGSITNIDTEVGAAGAYPRDMKLIMDPDIDKPIMCWGMNDGNFYTRSVTIDGNGANHAQASTQGSSAAITAPEFGWDICYDTNANIFVLVHRDPTNGGGSVRLGYQTEPASGQHKISWISTVYQFDTDPETPRCVFDPNNNKVIIAFGDGGGHDIGALIGTVSGTGSSATISLGTTVLVNGAGPNKPKMAWNTTDGVAGFFFQNKNNNQNQLITLKTSGTTVHYNAPVQVGSENVDAMAFWYQSSTGNFNWSAKGRIGWISSTGTPTAAGSGASAATVGSGNYDLSSWLGASINDFEPSQGCDLPEHPLVTMHLTTQGGSGGDKLKVITLTTAGQSSNAANAEKLIGFAEAAISDGNTGTIKLHGNVVGNQSSLTIGSQYYIQGDGTIGTSGDSTIGNIKAGTAVSATQLVICDPRV